MGSYMGSFQTAEINSQEGMLPLYGFFLSIGGFRVQGLVNVAKVLFLRW